MLFPNDIWKYEIMEFLPKPIKKIPYINDLKLIINNPDRIYKLYDVDDVEFNSFYESWKNRQHNRYYINMDFEKLDLLYDDPE